MSEKMSERVSEDMSDRVSENSILGCKSLIFTKFEKKT